MKERVINTLLGVASMLAKGVEHSQCAEELEQAILALEIAEDNAVSNGEPTEELERLRQQLLGLKKELCTHE